MTVRTLRPSHPPPRLLSPLLWLTILHPNPHLAGVAISWDGRTCAHCSAVPLGVAAEDALLSVFLSEYSRVHDARERMAELEAALAVRCRQSPAPALLPGDFVWVKWDRRGDGRCRRALGCIGEWRSDGGLTIVWRPASRDVTLFPAERPPQLAHAGAVVEAPAVGGAELVGRRVAVFWPGEDRNFAGRVTAWVDGEHTVAYDDGEELTETLYWPNGSPGFVLLSE